MSITASCRIDESQAQCLDRLAQEQGTTRAGVIKGLIDGLTSTPDSPVDTGDTPVDAVDAPPTPDRGQDLAPMVGLALLGWCLYRARRPRP